MSDAVIPTKQKIFADNAKSTFFVSRGAKQFGEHWETKKVRKALRLLLSYIYDCLTRKFNQQVIF